MTKKILKLFQKKKPNSKQLNNLIFAFNVCRFVKSNAIVIANNKSTLGIGSGGGKSTAIGVGMWLGIIMAFNVWFVIWPNQKRALGIIETDPDTKAKSAKTAMLFSRANTLLSLPMLLSMVAAQNLY